MQGCNQSREGGHANRGRAASYFVLCLQIGAWPNTETILPDLLCRPENRDKHVKAFKTADKLPGDGTVNLKPMITLLSRLLAQQAQ